MARKPRNLSTKKAIYVFWEGESEEAYIKFLSNEFNAQATIRKHREKGLFVTAQAYYRGNKRFISNVTELDEIWFFFDTEVEKGKQWEESMNCLIPILTSRSDENPITIRLLMTSCCVEYWFLLHYERIAPAMATPADKEKIIKALQKHVPSYKKGAAILTEQIAINYPTAIANGRWVLQRLRNEGMPDHQEKRDKWLFRGTHTFTTVHEALEMLCRLPRLR